MRKLISSLAAVALFLFASVASAGIKNCNATLVTQSICGDTTQDVLYLRLAGESRQDVVNALAKRAGWTANVTCTQAMVTAATCTAGQLNTSIPNPETKAKAKAASRYLREVVKTAVRDEKVDEIRTAGAAALPPVDVTD